MIYTVKSIAESPREWSGHGKTFLSYKVDFEAEDGILERGVEWNKVADSRAPALYEQVAGSLEEGKFGPKFRIDYEATKELHQGGSQTRSPASSEARTGSKGSWQPEHERDPQRAACILRQHSQEMAIRVVVALGVDGADQEAVKHAIRGWTDRFDADVIEAGQTASRALGPPQQEGEASPPPASPASDQTSADDAPQYLQKLLEDSFVDATGAHALALFIAEKFNLEQRARAEEGLKDPDLQGGTVAKLRSAYEKAKGQPVPSIDSLSDLPF